MARKAKDLDSLLRLHDWTVDERRRELGSLIAREDLLVRVGEELDRRLAREQRTAAADPLSAGLAYAAFARAHGLQREQVERMVELVRIEIERARDRLADAYRDYKVFEEVQRERQRQEDREEARKEQVASNEVGQNQFRQRQG
jgi:flagellar export protein FliJ